MSAQIQGELRSAAPGEPIEDATAWTGADFTTRDTFTHRLSKPMVDEIIALGESLAKRGGNPWQVTAASCPLPRTEALIRMLYERVEHGPGFALLEGFPVDRLPESALIYAYCGFCAHFGTITQQNREGEFVLEVTNKGKGYDQNSRGYHSNAHLDFHNDGTNTVTLLCTQTAEHGGLSKLVSGPAVYNAILQSRPQHLAPLLHGFHHHRRNQRGADDPAVTAYRTPVFSFIDQKFHMAYAGPSIFFCENEGIAISAQEKAALAYFEEVVERPELHVAMELRRGDLQFVNNFLVLHARASYTDSAEHRRRLLRLWLDDESSQRLGPGKMDWYLPECSRFTANGGIARLAR